MRFKNFEFIKLSALLLFLVLSFICPARAAVEKEEPKPIKESTQGLFLTIPEAQTRSYQKLIANIGYLLEKEHYARLWINDDVSERFLNKYLSDLDYNHVFFLKSDIDEFTQKYRHQLDDLIQQGDPTPAFVIFDRYIKRRQARENAIKEMIKENFDFTTDETIVSDRSKLPWPVDEADANQIWRKLIKFELLQGRLNKEKPEDILKKIVRRHDRSFKEIKTMDAEQLIKIYLDSLCHIYDPHTSYLTATEIENFKINHINLKLQGIGAVLKSDDGYAKIVSLVPGGPADMDKRLKPNDKIVAVAQGGGEPVDVVEMKLDKVVELIRGKPGTEVRLTVIPADSPDGSIRKVISLIRNDIKLTEQEAKGRVYEVPDEMGKMHRYGVLILNNFYDHGSEHCEKIVKRLISEKVEGIAIDMRKNGGGLLEQAIDISGLFIDRGAVVQAKDSKGKVNVFDDPESNCVYKGPLVMLVSRLSASATEIVAAVLQDYQRAIIVGDQATHGKGTVQQILELKSLPFFGGGFSPGAIKLTISKFYRVSGGSTQNRGVIPDIQIPSVFDYYEFGEQYLPNSLPYDEIPPVQHPIMGMTRGYISGLAEKSAQRVARDVEFEFVREDIDFLKKKLADKSISLNEAKRLKEKNDLLARSEARDKKRKSLPPRTYKVYEVTQEMVAKNQPMKELVIKNPPVMDIKDDPADDEKIPDDKEVIVDPQLDESIYILRDYVNELSKKKVVAR